MVDWTNKEQVISVVAEDGTALEFASERLQKMLRK